VCATLFLPCWRLKFIKIVFIGPLFALFFQIVRSIECISDWRFKNSCEIYSRSSLLVPLYVRDEHDLSTWNWTCFTRNCLNATTRVVNDKWITGRLPIVFYGRSLGIRCLNTEFPSDRYLHRHSWDSSRQNTSASVYCCDVVRFIITV